MYFYQIKCIIHIVYTVYSHLNKKNLHGRITSLREEVWDNKTSLTPPPVTYMPVQSQESEQSYIYICSNKTFVGISSGPGDLNAFSFLIESSFVTFFIS
jgi:hypothetical protein